MSIDKNENNAAESQFQTATELVERNEDTGVMQVESLCMNCHENVSLSCPVFIYPGYPETDSRCRE